MWSKHFDHIDDIGDFPQGLAVSGTSEDASVHFVKLLSNADGSTLATMPIDAASDFVGDGSVPLLRLNGNKASSVSLLRLDHLAVVKKVTARQLRFTDTDVFGFDDDQFTEYDATTLLQTNRIPLPSEMSSMQPVGTNLVTTNSDDMVVVYDRNGTEVTRRHISKAFVVGAAGPNEFIIDNGTKVMVYRFSKAGIEPVDSVAGRYEDSAVVSGRLLLVVSQVDRIVLDSLQANQFEEIGSARPTSGSVSARLFGGAVITGDTTEYRFQGFDLTTLTSLWTAGLGSSTFYDGAAVGVWPDDNASTSTVTFYG